MADDLPGRSESVRLVFCCDESEADEQFFARVKAIKDYVDQHWDELKGSAEPIDTDTLPVENATGRL